MTTDRRTHGYSLLELIAAIALLSIVIGCFSAILRSIVTLEDRYTAETQAVICLGNTLERIKALPSPTSELAEQILQEEFRHSQLSEREDFTPACRQDHKSFVMSVLRTPDTTLAEVKLRPTP